MKVYQRISLFILVGAIGILAASLVFKNKVSDTVIPDLAPSNILPSNNTVPPSNNQPNPPATLPSVFLLKVPFTSQAPTANWDELHNEACEEASSIMANAYFIGRTDTTLPAAYVEDEITKLTQYQDRAFGYHLDTTIAETAKMIEDVYGLKTKQIKNFSENDIKQELNQNHVILVSEYGRALGNPNYKSPGPIHHMLVIKGYDKLGIITNDSGTRKGLNYAYSFSTIYDAAADWDHSTNNVDTSQKIALVVWK